MTTKSETTVERVGGYRVVRRLATGGTSDVLLAKAEGPLGFERTVVLKILLSEFRSDDELARMFAREAYAYARLGHPAIVRLFDFFSLPTSRTVGSELPGPPSTRRPPRSADEAQLVMVLEHVDGPALSRLRSLLKAIGRQMDDHAAIWIASRIFAALAAAHAATDEAGTLAPVIHRDVNPSNVLVPWDGEVKLADFGVAKVMGQNGESVAGMIKGTYGYMAPEQVTGGALTPAADVYAGAIILWELLARRRAFSRTGKAEVEALRAMMEPQLPSIDTLRPDVDGSVRAALNRALEPKASNRTITAEEMVGILQRAVPGFEGRDRLVAILGLVRNDTRISNAPMSAADPSMHPIARAANAANATETQVSPPMRGAPPAPSSSSPSSSSRRVVVRPSGTSRTTAPYGNPASRPNLPAAAPSSGNTLGPPPRTSSRGALGAVRETPSKTKVAASRPSLPGVHNDAPSRTKILVAPTQVSATSEPPRRPSASHRLAAALPETMRDPGDQLTVPTPMVQPKDIRESINDILEGPIAPNETGRFKRTDALGRIPASPGALHAAKTPAIDLPIQDFPKATKSFDSSASPDFGGTGRQSSPDVGIGPPTPRAHDRTMAMEARPVEPTHPSARFEEETKRSVDVGATGPMPRYVPPAAPAQAPAPTAPSRPQMPAVAPHHPTAPMPAVAAMPSAPPQAPVASRPAPPLAAAPRKSQAPLAIGACLVVVIGAVIAGSVTYVRGQARARIHAAATESVALPVPPPPPPLPTPSPSPAPTPEPTIAPVPTPSVEASAAPTPAASAPTAEADASAAIASTDGLLKTTGSLPGRRIFVDTAVVGQTPESVTVKCGQHVVHLGSSGKNQTIDVPCGGEIVVADKY